MQTGEREDGAWDLVPQSCAVEPAVEIEPTESSGPSSSPTATLEAATNDDPIPSGGLLRHPTFWYTEGTIVVKADDTLYRLFRTYLKRSSAYFANAIAPLEAEQLAASSTKLSTADEQTVDGCPVVVLEGLCSTDFDTWLNALENGGDYDRLPSFSEAASLLRTATLLASPRIEKLAKNALTRLIPPSSASSEITPHEALEAIVLARAHALPFVLAGALTILLGTDDPVRLATDALSQERPELAISLGDLASLGTRHREMREQWVMDWLGARSLPFDCDSTTRKHPENCWALHAARLLGAAKESLGGFHPERSYDRLSGVFEWKFCPSCESQVKRYWRARKGEMEARLSKWICLAIKDV